MKLKLKLTSEPNAKPGQRFAQVFNEHGVPIGDANDVTYHGRGWAVHCISFAGFYSHDEVEIIP